MTDLILTSTTSALAPKWGSLGVLWGGLEHNGTDSLKDRAKFVLLGLFLEPIREGGGFKSQNQEASFCDKDFVFYRMIIGKVAADRGKTF